MNPAKFWEILKKHNLTYFSGVPDSTLRTLHDSMLRESGIRYIPAVREDVALGIASAAYFAGKLGGVMMQNSGIGNIVNPLTSFNLIYRIPVLLIVGWRGYGGPPNDAPEHWVMGVKTTGILELLEIPFEILESNNLEAALSRLLDSMAQKSIPGVLLVRPGVLL